MRVDRFQTAAGCPVLVVIMVSSYAASSAGTVNTPDGQPVSSITLPPLLRRMLPMSPKEPWRPACSLSLQKPGATPIRLS